MTGFRTHLPLPPLDQVNQGLSACPESLVLEVWGVPGRLTEDCSAPEGAITGHLRHDQDVGPFKVSGLGDAIDRLRALFLDVKADLPALYEAVRTDGLLCVRARRSDSNRYSNHSWGAAIDIFFGENDIPQGKPLVQAGVLALVPYFNRYGWYWGGGFSGRSVDTMHFELAAETIRAIAARSARPAGGARAARDDGEAVDDPFASAQPPRPAAAQLPLGPVCAAWDYDTHGCARELQVLSFAGTAASHFLTKLAVDADGAPRAYHAGNVGSFDWLANLSDSDNLAVQGVDGIGPEPGFIVSATSLVNPAYPVNDTRRYVDASQIPYVVLPAATYPAADGTAARKGCLAYVVDTHTGGASGAIFADSGHAVGEGSIALALSLGLFPFRKDNLPKVRGFDGDRFLYIVFHGTQVLPPWPVGEIQNRALAAFKAWGGEAQVRALYPDLPPMSLPREVKPLAWEDVPTG